MKKLLLFPLCLMGTAAVCLAQLTNVTVGSSPNNEDGDSPQSAYAKLNWNEQYLLAHGGGGGSVPDPLTINTVNAVNVNATNLVGNASGLTNMGFASLKFSPITSASPTNPVVGFLNFTNGGTWYRIPVCTNVP